MNITDKLYCNYRHYGHYMYPSDNFVSKTEIKSKSDFYDFVKEINQAIASNHPNADFQIHYNENTFCFSKKRAINIDGDLFHSEKEISVEHPIYARSVFDKFSNVIKRASTLIPFLEKKRSLIETRDRKLQKIKKLKAELDAS